MATISRLSTTTIIMTVIIATPSWPLRFRMFIAHASEAEAATLGRNTLLLSTVGGTVAARPPTAGRPRR